MRRDVNARVFWTRLHSTVAHSAVAAGVSHRWSSADQLPLCAPTRMKEPHDRLRRPRALRMHAYTFQLEHAGAVGVGRAVADGNGQALAEKKTLTVVRSTVTATAHAARG